MDTYLTKYSQMNIPNILIAFFINETSLDKTCLCHMQTSKMQISLRIHAVWWADLLFIS